MDTQQDGTKEFSNNKVVGEAALAGGVGQLVEKHLSIINAAS
jgi:hypothetical protein